jgi:hypothetical protein
VSGTTKCTEWSTTNKKHESKPATRCNHDELELNKALTNENCGSKGYRMAESVYFLAFSVHLATKAKTNYKAHKNISRTT